MKKMNNTLKDQLRTSTLERYNNKVQKHSENDLFYLSEKILEWFYNDEFGIVIIHGQQGYGKSCYALISCAEVYGHDIDNADFFYNWEAVKKHVVWHPKTFIDLSKKKLPPHDKYHKIHPHSNKKEPLVVWDDAGYYLNNMKWNDKFCIEVSRYLELARSRWGAIVFTCSHQQQVLSKIRNIPHAWTIPIRKMATPKRGKPKYRYKHDLRYAKLHKSWCSEDLKRSGKKGKESDVFHARLPGRYDSRYPKGKDENGRMLYVDPRTGEYTYNHYHFNTSQKKVYHKPVSYGFFSWYKPFRDNMEEKGIEAVEIAAQELGL
jgi:hypothetical protein